MAKTLIDVDEEQLAAAQEVLKTETKKDTVNAALRQVTALAVRRRDLQRLVSGGLPDLADEDVMRAAWQQEPATWLTPTRWPGWPGPRWRQY
jgi:Arc/MetJ family transcription regulator